MRRVVRLNLRYDIGNKVPNTMSFIECLLSKILDFNKKIVNMKERGRQLVDAARAPKIRELSQIPLGCHLFCFL